MLQDGPGIEEYSQHTQVFAVLTDTVAGEQAKENLRRRQFFIRKNIHSVLLLWLYYLIQSTGKNRNV